MHDLYLIQHLENKKTRFPEKEENCFSHKAFIIFVVVLVLLQHKLIISFFRLEASSADARRQKTLDNNYLIDLTKSPNGCHRSSLGNVCSARYY